MVHGIVQQFLAAGESVMVIGDLTNGSRIYYCATYALRLCSAGCIMLFKINLYANKLHTYFYQ